MSNIKIENVKKYYGDASRVLEDVNISISDGEFFTLLGPSGCGKTTLLRIISGFLKQSSGSVSFDSEKIDDLPAYRRNIGMVFQDYAIFPHLNVRDNIAFGLRARNIEGADLRARVDEALQIVRLQGLEQRMPSALSGGQQQRVGIARALAIRPRLLLMDEPLSNLDAKLRVEMRDDIREIQSKLGITTIYVTHDQEEALAISDRICVMHGGLVQQIGTSREVYEYPANRFTAGFLGKMNFVPAAAFSLDASAGAAGIAAFRPEDVRLAGGADDGLSLTGRVETVTYLGRETAVAIATGHGRVEVNLHGAIPDQAILPGADITVAVPPARVKLFTEGGRLLSDEGGK